MPQRLRQLENIQNVDYNPDKKTIFYAEDQNTQNEILQRDGKVINQIVDLAGGPVFSRGTINYRPLVSMYGTAVRGNQLTLQNTHLAGQTYTEMNAFIQALIIQSMVVAKELNITLIEWAFSGITYSSTIVGEVEFSFEIRDFNNIKIGSAYLNHERPSRTSFSMDFSGDWLLASTAPKVKHLYLDYRTAPSGGLFRFAGDLRIAN